MSEGFKLLNEMFNKILQIPNSSIAKKSQLQAIQQSYNDSVSYFYSITKGCCYCFDKYGDFYPDSETYKISAENLKNEYQDFYIQVDNN